MSKRKPRGRRYAGEQSRSRRSVKGSPDWRRLRSTAPAGQWRNDLLDNMYCADNGRYYETPVDWYGLARQFGYASWHQSALYFKRNVLSGCFIPRKLLSAGRSVPLRRTGLCSAAGTAEMRKNRLNGPLGFRHSLAKYTRQGSDLDTYWFIRAGLPGSPVHPRLGMPRHQPGHKPGITACRSISPACCLPTCRTLLTSSASSTMTTDRAGCIVYVNSAMADQESLDKLKKTLTDTRRGGAFKTSCCMRRWWQRLGADHLPFSQITAKDEFVGVKTSTRADMLAAHRVPPQLMGVIRRAAARLVILRKRPASTPSTS